MVAGIGGTQAAEAVARPEFGFIRDEVQHGGDIGMGGIEETEEEWIEGEVALAADVGILVGFGVDCDVTVGFSVGDPCNASRLCLTSESCWAYLVESLVEPR